MNRSYSAFTIVEVVIIVVISGMLAAIMIPVFQKVNNDAIIKTVQLGAGDTLSSAERTIYEEEVANGDVKKWIEIHGTAANSGTLHTSTDSSTPISSPSSMTIPTLPFQHIVISGQSFYLIPKQDANETDIAGKTFWLVPSP